LLLVFSGADDFRECLIDATLASVGLPHSKLPSSPVHIQEGNANTSPGAPMQRRRPGVVQRRLYQRDGGQSTLRECHHSLGNPTMGAATVAVSSYSVS
jgi:hypothetical protein